MEKIENDKKEIILSLIKDDLINSRLMSILCNAGLNPINYYLNLKETIFKLAGLLIKRDDFLTDFENASRITSDVDIFDNPEVLHAIAESLYKRLKPSNQEYA